MYYDVNFSSAGSGHRQHSQLDQAGYLCCGGADSGLYIGGFIPWLQDFRRELRYLNSEINRTEGREQLHWIKRKKRLIRSILPFYRY